MMFDLISTTALTAGAATTVATLAIAFGRTLDGGIRIAATLSAWFTAIVAIAATQLFYYERGPLAVPGLGLAVAGPVAVLALMFAGSPSLRARLEQVPLPVLIGVHAVRVLGILFVALYLRHRLPAPFAPSAGWGDVFIGVTALPLAFYVSRVGAAARPLVITWNLIGIADLISAVGLGVTSSPGPMQLIHSDVSSAIMTSLPWLLIPAFMVPLLFAVHLGVAWRLRAAHPDRAEAGPVNRTAMT